MMRTKDDAWTLTWETSQQSCIYVTPPPAHHTEQAEWQCAQSQREDKGGAPQLISTRWVRKLEYTGELPSASPREETQAQKRS